MHDSYKEIFLTSVRSYWQLKNVPNSCSICFLSTLWINCTYFASSNKSRINKALNTNLPSINPSLTSWSEGVNLNQESEGIHFPIESQRGEITLNLKLLDRFHWIHQSQYSRRQQVNNHVERKLAEANKTIVNLLFNLRLLPGHLWLVVLYFTLCNEIPFHLCQKNKNKK